MDNILHELFARQAFTSSLVERNFGQVSGWIELVGVLMLRFFILYAGQLTVA